MPQIRTYFADNAPLKYFADLNIFYSGLNQFSDLTTPEFMSLQTYTPAPGSSSSDEFKLKTDNLTPVNQLPEEVDWRQQGVITEVHNQGEN